MTYPVTNRNGSVLWLLPATNHRVTDNGWIVTDDPIDREAWLVATSVLGALFAFGLTWRYYPPVGTALTLLSLGVALAAVVGRPYWAAYSWVGFRGAALLGVLVALDDAVEHAFGWPMPLDLFWKHWLYGVVSSV